MNSKEEILKKIVSILEKNQIKAKVGSDGDYESIMCVDSEDYRSVAEDIGTAMEDYRPIGEQEARQKVIGELVEWMEAKKYGKHPFYQNGITNCIQHAKSMIKEDKEQDMQNEQTKEVCTCGNVEAITKDNVMYCISCGGVLW